MVRNKWNILTGKPIQIELNDKNENHSYRNTRDSRYSGGVETHCEELFPRIADEKHEVIVIRRPEYKSVEYGVSKYKGVTIKDVKTLPGKHFEAITHTFIAVLYARKIHADIVHIHAIGPSLMIPIVRILGMKAVMTHHGPDYDRQNGENYQKVS